MIRRVGLFGAAALAAIGLALTTAGSAAPNALHFAGGAAGGRIATAVFPGTASSADAFRRGVAASRAYFGSSAHLVGIVRSRDGSTMIGGFDAVRQGRRISGAIVAANPGGDTAHVAVMFDEGDRFARSVRPLFMQFVGTLKPSSHGGGAAMAGAPVPPLRNVQANDRTVTASIPATWHIDALESGVFAASGPDGAEVDQEIPFNFTDPRSSLRGRMYPTVPYPGSPGNALAMLGRLRPALQLHVERVIPEASQGGNFQVAEVGGTERLKNGTSGRFIGFVGLSPLNPYGTWTVTLKLMAAPATSFGREFPTLSAIYESYIVNQGNRQAQVQANIQSNQQLSNNIVAHMQGVTAANTATFNASMAHASAVQGSIDRSTAGFIHYLNDTTVVQNASGARATVGQNFGSALVRDNPNEFQEVPVSQY